MSKYQKITALILAFLMLLSMSACGLLYLPPKSVEIDGVVYRNGFYGDLYPLRVPFTEEPYTVGKQSFYRVNFQPFDLIRYGIEGPILYCAEAQWEQAKSYYLDNSHFVFYMKIGGQFDDDAVLTELADVDLDKFDQLMEFAKLHSYDPFAAGKSPELRELPIQEDNIGEIRFFKQSKDGLFTSDQSYTFRIYDQELVLIYVYDYGHGEYEAMQAVDLPVELSEYFMAIIRQNAR
ncbi:MAG: hypothetical protein HFE85_01915 [Clostridiales bacterium]|nr:hypothetical protein [Clostridiales bacterium]